MNAHVPMNYALACMGDTDNIDVLLRLLLQLLLLTQGASLSIKRTSPGTGAASAALLPLTLDPSRMLSCVKEQRSNQCQLDSYVCNEGAKSGEGGITSLC